MRYCWVFTVLILVTTANRAVSAPNILLIIADDMGVEALSVYGLGEAAPTTVNLDEIARQGVVFKNFWSQPVCSPTRATLMTGRYGFRTGIGRPIAPGASGGASGMLPEPPAKPRGAPYEPPRGGFRVDPGALTSGLRSTEFTLPMALAGAADGTYQTAAIGKWHLADVDNGWLQHPRNAGIGYYSVAMHGINSFFAWRKNLNGEVVGTTAYSAIDRADTAIDWISEQGDRPWFMWLSFILPHTPLHLPPEELLQSDYSDLNATADPRDDAVRYFHAMIEAMDSEIGRVLDSMDAEVRENTYIVFIGDNGTANVSVSEPFQAGRAKGTVYQGGVNVPLIVSGPGVERGAVSEALVNSTDLFATILEMAEVDPVDAVPSGVQLDSTSFFAHLSRPELPSARDWVFADVFSGGFQGIAGADYAMRNTRYKLMRHQGTEEFYDLVEDPYEHDNLLDSDLSADEQLQYEWLRAQIHALRESD